MPSLNMGQHPGNDRLPLTSPTNEQSRTPRTDAAFNSFSVVSVDSTGSGSQPADMSASIPEDVRNLVIASGDEVTLNSKASDEDRFLFELHRKYKNSRGKGMWEAIGKEYLKAYPGDRDHSNARLQMRHTRALRRNAQWPEEVYNTLVHIYETQERAKYAAYAAMLKDKVGTKYGEFKAADVEAMLVRIGFEDPIPDTNSKARRRQHNNLRKKSENGQLPVSAMPNAWGNGFAAVPTTQFPLPSPHGQSIAVDHYDYRQARQLAVPIPTFNDATEEKFLDTLVERHGDGTGRMDSDDSRNSNSSNSPVDYTMATGNADGSLSTFQQGSPSPYPSGARRLKSEYQ
ncbi:hypothetical protein SEUCBS140593_000959 [Sporothrix eucalyptigena]|uniref:Myb-like domain-containing protein n=1 Tax=Sporothrix eucalyptigena TaxID=1812306 RepID=A0ABP0AU74_9PEZI